MVMKKRPVFLWKIAFSLAMVFLSIITIVGQGGTGRGREAMSQKGGITAPDFPPELDWLNTNKPLSLKDLRGKFVLLDFWTYC